MKKTVFAVIAVAFVGCMSGDSSKDQPKAKDAEKSVASAEREEFRKIIFANVENPKDFEIVSWGDKKTHPVSGKVYRDVKFRCALIGSDRNNNPVMLDTGTVVYKGDVIEQIGLEKCFRVVWPDR